MSQTLKERLAAMVNGVEDLNEDDMDMSIDDGMSESSYIVGYGSTVVKIKGARLETYEGSKVTNLVLDFESKDGKTLTEKFMMTGAKGQIKTGQGRIFGSLNQIMSLINVLGLYEGEKKGKALYAHGEVAEVTYTNYGAEKTEEAIIFPDLIGKVVTLAHSSKKINLDMKNEGDAYAKFCIAEAKKFVKAKPKAAASKKFDEKANYIPSFRWVTETSVKHFCDAKGFMQSELGNEEPEKLTAFLEKNDKGLIFDSRMLKVEELSDSQRKKYHLNEYGKVEEPEDGADEPDVEPEPESEDEDEDW